MTIEIKKIIKLTSLLLVFLMTVRHAMYYYGLGYMTTEMGHNQSYIGILLIPVTASFGMFLFYDRTNLTFSKLSVFKFSLIGLLPIFLSIANGHRLADLISYSIYDTIRRPSFLILMPIALSALASYWKKFDLFILLLVTVLLFYFSENFIINYLFIFTIFRLTNYRINNFYRIFIFVFPAYLLASFAITYLEIVRINVFLELFYSYVYLFSLFSLSKFLLKTFPFYFQKVKSFGVPILYFYIFQAILFTLSAWFVKNMDYLIISTIFTMLIFFTSFFLAKKTANVFNF